MTDEELVGRYRAKGDPDDFRVLVERHSERVLRLVSSVLGPFRDLDAEETAQEVFLRIHDKMHQFDGRSKFTTWLYKVAFGVALNHSKLARIRLPHDSAALQSLTSSDDPLGALVKEERAAVLAAALETLPVAYRTTVYMYYWQDLSVGEIAELLGAPANTVKSYLMRARERLARALGERGVRP